MISMVSDFDAKIVKGEGRKTNLFDFFAEPHPLFSKDTKRRGPRQMKTEFSRFDVAGLPAVLPLPGGAPASASAGKPSAAPRPLSVAAGCRICMVLSGLRAGRRRVGRHDAPCADIGPLRLQGDRPNLSPIFHYFVRILYFCETEKTIKIKKTYTYGKSL
nr:hypothetical protein [uncultured Alistipes sp.]